jgi:hypothetical protein
VLVAELSVQGLDLGDAYTKAIEKHDEARGTILDQDASRHCPVDRSSKLDYGSTIDILAIGDGMTSRTDANRGNRKHDALLTSGC